MLSIIDHDFIRLFLNWIICQTLQSTNSLLWYVRECKRTMPPPTKSVGTYMMNFMNQCWVNWMLTNVYWRWKEIESQEDYIMNYIKCQNLVLFQLSSNSDHVSVFDCNNQLKKSSHDFTCVRHIEGESAWETPFKFVIQLLSIIVHSAKNATKQLKIIIFCISNWSISRCSVNNPKEHESPLNTCNW